MKTHYTKSIALILLLASTFAPYALSATNNAPTQAQVNTAPTEPTRLQRLKDFLKPANLKEQFAELFGFEPKTTATDKPAVEKNMLQKTANISGAFVRGVARGLLSGMPSEFVNSSLELADDFKIGNLDNNADLLIDIFFDTNQVRALSELIVGGIDDTKAAMLTENLTAAFVHAFCMMDAFGIKEHSKIKNLRNFAVVFANRLVKGLDTRTAQGVKKYVQLAAIGIIESINLKYLSEYNEKNASENIKFTHVFRPLVGATAVARTLLVDKIIAKREATGTLKKADQITRARTLLNGTLGVVMSLIANLATIWYVD